MIVSRFVSFIFFFYLNLGSINCIQAQEPQDSLVYASAVNNLSKLFEMSVNENMHLYNGSEYVFSGHNIQGVPYFNSDSLINAVISYNNVVYRDVPAYYDLTTDKIIIKDEYQQFFIQLLSEKVDSFSLAQHVFINIDSAKANHFLFKPGFYERLYNSDELSLFARREKAIENYIVEGVAQSKFVQYDHYFIKKDGIFYAIEGKNELLNLLDDKKDALEKYIRKDKINFKKDLENSLTQTVTYYSEIK